MEIELFNDIPELDPQKTLYFVFPEKTLLPKYDLHENAGMDFRARIEKAIPIENGIVYKIPLGFKIAFPSGFELQIRPRSGLALNGIIIPNSPSTIDPSYRGEVCVELYNLLSKPYVIQPFERVCQGVISHYLYNLPFSLSSYKIVFIVNRRIFEEWHDIFVSKRKTGGFGSTGRV